MDCFASFLLIFFVAFAWAQSELQQKVWSVVVYTVNGDSTPFSDSGSRRLTTWGAQQLFGSGVALRQRYLMPTGVENDAGASIDGLSPISMASDGVNIYSAQDQFVSASALAFLQGLYPPLQDLESTSPVRVVDGSTEVNGTVVDSPLNGYQYPEMVVASGQDAISVQVAGHENCAKRENAISKYMYEDDMQKMTSVAQPFYDSLDQRIFDGVFSNGTVNFLNADYIFEYLNYQWIHNWTVQDYVTYDDLQMARYLAGRWALATNNNNTGYGSESDSKVFSVAGRTLAYNILQSFQSAIGSNSAQSKMSLLFGTYQPMVAFSALAKLGSHGQDEAKGLPNNGASMMFELVSWESDPSAQFPSSRENLEVRLLVRNSTNASDVGATLTLYPMFGRGPNQASIPYNEFVDEMVDIMMSPSEWCRECESENLFCAAYVPYGGSSHYSNGAKNCGLNPAIGGVIGAVVTIVVIGSLVCAVLLCMGYRHRRNHARRDSWLAGFKGNGKSHSDRSNSSATGDQERVGSCVGSWELGDRTTLNPAHLRPPYSEREDSLSLGPLERPVQPRESV